MAHLFVKGPRVCDCGYETWNRGAWSTHRRAHCRLRDTPERLRTDDLERQLTHLKQQLAEKDQRVAHLERQLAETTGDYLRQLAAKDQQLMALIGVKRRRDASQRGKMPEPRRRSVAEAQDWLCANPDGECLLGERKLREYDVDHVVPLSHGGTDDATNLQALCPACHRRKTERDRVVVLRRDVETVRCATVSRIAEADQRAHPAPSWTSGSARIEHAALNQEEDPLRIAVTDEAQ